MLRFIRYIVLHVALASTLAAVPAVMSADAARAEVRLNEVLYDPAGDDAGAEFVELWNDADVPVSLLGISIEAGDGARPGSWVALFAGAEGDSVGARSPFLIVAARLTGAIQNGPDAIRLTRGGVVLDLLGWGALATAEFYEGAPAVDAASGESLARRSDGFDSERNDADWGAGRPTPGAPNHPPYRLDLSRAVIRPEVAWPGEQVTFGVTATNSGTRALTAGEWGMTIRSRAISSADSSIDVWGDAARITGPPLAAGDSARLLPLLLPERTAGIEWRLISWTSQGVVPGNGGEATHDSISIRGRVAPGPVVIGEFAYRDDGAGEWVELVALEPIESWNAFALGDGTGVARRLEPRGGYSGARAGEIRVAASDPARFAARFGVSDTLLLATEGGWSSFNDGASASEAVAPYADIVRLLGPEGVPSDAVAYEEGWSERGGSVERLSPLLPSSSRRNWAESVSPAGGTPGAANSVAAYRDGTLVPSALLGAPARVLRRGAGDGVGALVLELGAGVAERSVRLSILDLRGRVRRVLAAGERFGGPGALIWDGRDDRGQPVEPGLYVARLEAARSGSALRSASLSIAVAPRDRKSP